MLNVEIVFAHPYAVRRAAHGVSMSPTVRRGEAILGAGLQENAALLRAVRRRGSQAARDGGQPPFLDICLDEDEARLTKVDVNRRGPVGSNGGKEVLRL